MSSPMTNSRIHAQLATPALSRRNLILGAAATAGVSATGVGIPWSASAASLSTVTPRMADSVPDAFGVVLHPSWADSPYADFDALLHWLVKLRIRHVRTRLTPLTHVLRLFDRLAANGIKVNAVCGALGDPQTMDSLMKKVADYFPRPADVFSAFEGINEPNNDGRPWIEETRQKTQDLYDARRKYGLTAIPIIAPALARVNGGEVEGDTTLEQAQNLGSMAGWVDGGTMHVYPRALPPSSDIDYFTECAQVVAGDKPITVTEGGYFTAPDYVGGARRVSEGVASAYGPQKIFEHLVAGNVRYFRYEFLEKPRGTSWDRLATFGMLRTRSSSWEPKPEFGATRRLLQKFSDPGRAFTPAALTYGLGTGPRGMKSALFAKRDGTHLLALWLDTPIWDPEAERLTIKSIGTKVGQVRLDLGSARDGVVTHLVDHTRRTTFTRAKSVDVPLTAGVTVVKLLPS